jgi:putative ABC transport system substrate-binding protein
LAEELVRRQVAVIIAPGSTPAALAAKAATQTIPIIIANGQDPVELGLVASLARPGGNVTGVTQLASDTVGKRLELLHELMPSSRTLAVLVNPANRLYSQAEAKEAEAAALTLGSNLLVLSATDLLELDAAFVELSQQRAEGLSVSADSMFFAMRDHVVTHVARLRLPTIYPYREL